MCKRCRSNESVTNACKVPILDQRNKHIATSCDRALRVLKIKDYCYNGTEFSMCMRPRESGIYDVKGM